MNHNFKSNSSLNTKKNSSHNRLPRVTITISYSNLLKILAKKEYFRQKNEFLNKNFVVIKSSHFLKK